jgi:hypothetical protein
MADVATTIISGAFAVAGSMGSIWLKDYLERKRQVPAAAVPSSAPFPPAPASQVSTARPGSNFRAIYYSVGGFVVGAVSSYIRPHVIHKAGTHPEAIVSLVIMIVVVLVGIVHHAKPQSGGSLALFEVETIGLWAAFAFGWSLVHGSVWDDIIGVSITSWLGSAISGLLFIPLLRWMYNRRT